MNRTDTEVRTITPQVSRAVVPRDIRNILRHAAEAGKDAPGPYRLRTESCSCGDAYDGGCSHGEYPYEIVAEGLLQNRYPKKQYPNSNDRFEAATVWSNEDVDCGSVASMWALLDPATVTALCGMAMDWYQDTESKRIGDGFRSLFDKPLRIDLSQVSEHDLWDEIKRRYSEAQARETARLVVNGVGHYV